MAAKHSRRNKTLDPAISIANEEYIDWIRPYRVQLFIWIVHFGPFLYKREHVFELLLVPGLESRRIVKNKLWVILEYKLFLNVVDAALIDTSAYYYGIR